MGTNAGKLAGLQKHVATGSYAQGKSEQACPSETRKVHSRSLQFQFARDIQEDSDQHESSFDGWPEQGS